MIFGSERSSVQKTLLRKILWRLRGDFHLGRWLRFFHLSKSLRRIEITPQRILDAGCGEGGISFFLGKMFPSAFIDGVDINPSDIELCKAIAKAQKKERFCFWQADLQKDLIKQKYDLIVMNNVLYAIPDYRVVVKRLLNALTEGGCLIVQDMDISQIVNGPALADAVRMGFEPEEFASLFKDRHIRIVLSEKTFGFFGKLSHRFFGHLRKSPLLINFFFPILLLISYFDTLATISKGSGFLIAIKMNRSISNL